MKKVVGKDYYEGYDNQVEGSYPLFQFFFTEDYPRSWDSKKPFSYSALRNGEIESINYDSSKLTVKFLNYSRFSYEIYTFVVGTPTTDKRIVDPSDHSKLFEFTPTEIWVANSLNDNEPILEDLRESIMEVFQQKDKIPKMAENFEARTIRKSNYDPFNENTSTPKTDTEELREDMAWSKGVVVPDGKHSTRRWERTTRKRKGHKRPNNPKKTDYDNQTLGQDFFKKKQQGKEDMRELGFDAEYVACAECGDYVFELESNTCCEECNDNLNEAFEWIAKENGEENLRDFMDSIDITDDDLNAETDLSMNADYTKGYTDVTEKVQHKDKYGRPKETVVQSLKGYAGNCPSCDKRINFPVGGGGLYCSDCQVYLLPSREKGLNKTLRYDAETFEANAKSGDKVYVITRRCEDYSAYRELDVAVFGSLTEARKIFNILFKQAKEEEYPDETIADAKSYMRWGDVGWGIESFMADDMIYELNEHIIGEKGDFYFDAEGFDAETEIPKKVIQDE